MGHDGAEGDLYAGQVAARTGARFSNANMDQPLHVLALFAHPDDAEFLAAGTLAHLADRSAKIHIATMTAGDCGSTVLSAAKISAIRRREAAKAAELIGADYRCIGEKDLCVFYDRGTLRKVMEAVRASRAELVFTHSPVDYMVDHETTSRLCQTACFGAMAPNFSTGARRAAKALRRVPHLYYARPFGGKNILGEEVAARSFVDVSSTFERASKMLARHESQRAFLRAQQEIADTLGMQRKMAERAGQLAGLALAEGFRQHLGQGFPADDLLERLLGGLVRTTEAQQIPRRPDALHRDSSE